MNNQAHYLKINFHNHTHFSFDGYNSMKQTYTCAKKAGFDAICITDHDTFEGPLRFQAWLKKQGISDLEVIPGEEVTCDDGTHIIGLFLSQAISSKKPIEVVEEIRAQNGLVYFPHPARKDGILSSNSRDQCVARGHFFELFNAKINNQYNDTARKELLDSTLLPLAGSDAHYNGDFGKCVCYLPKKESARATLESYLQTKTVTITGVSRSTGDIEYFPWYYRNKKRLALPPFFKRVAKTILPWIKNLKERNRSHKRELIFNNLMNESELSQVTYPKQPQRNI